MLIGYARASAAGESLDLQIEALKCAGADPVFVDDKRSGAKADHPKRKQALALLGEGDILVVWSTDRLDLNVRNVVKMMEEFGRRGIGFRSLKENIDTTTDAGKWQFLLCDALIASERALVRERSAAGRTAAKECGQVGGRKLKLDEKERAQANTLYRNSPHSVADICRKFDISRSTLYRYLD